MDIPYKGASNRIPDEGPFILFLFFTSKTKVSPIKRPLYGISMRVAA